jgi:transposase-like protein
VGLKGRLSNPRRDTQVQRRFTTRDVDELVAGYETGATVNELAARFGVHRTTVMHHLHRHGVRGRSLRKLTDEQRADTAQRYRRGETLDELADRFSVAPSTIRRALEAAGVPMRPRGRQPRP